MASFKSQESSLTKDALLPFQSAIAKGAYTALHPDRGDIENGGLAVLNDGGTVVEIRSPAWAIEPTPAHLRAAKLMIVNEDGVSRYTPTDKWDTKKPSLGGEVEAATCLEDGSWWKILPDGKTITLPNGNRAEAEHYGFQFEALATMFEKGTPPAYGYSDYFARTLRQELQTERFLHNHDLYAPPISEDPERITPERLSTHPYIRLVTRRMPYHLDFVPSMSWQQHIQMKNPEAMLAALNNYQAVQALTTLLTHGAPIRDGSFATTLGDHYADNPDSDFLTPPGAVEVLDEYGADAVPADWRELSRKLGSPSGGTYAQAAPYTLDALLDAADLALRSGKTISAVRTLGWHTDRFRLDKGTGEICNLGKAGGNLYKVLAVHELVGKLLVGLQEFHSGTVIPADRLFSMDDNPADRDLAVEVGNRNSLRVALLGKVAMLETPDGRDAVPPAVLLENLFAFTDAYDPVRPSSKAELRATLQPAPDVGQYKTGGASAVLADFYWEGSPLTHAEALRLAHQAEPSLPLPELLVLNARLRSNHVYKLYNEQQRFMK